MWVGCVDLRIWHPPDIPRAAEGRVEGHRRPPSATRHPCKFLLGFFLVRMHPRLLRFNTTQNSLHEDELRIILPSAYEAISGNIRAIAPPPINHHFFEPHCLVLGKYVSAMGATSGLPHIAI